MVIFTELITCSRHLTVKSSIVSVEENSPPLILVSTEECEDIDEEEGSDDSCDEDDCEECKIKQKGALVDSLPPIVVEGMYKFIFAFCCICKTSVPLSFKYTTVNMLCSK